MQLVIPPVLARLPPLILDRDLAGRHDPARALRGLEDALVVAPAIAELLLAHARGAAANAGALGRDHHRVVLCASRVRAAAVVAGLVGCAVVPSRRRGLDLAEEDAEDGDRGRDDGHAGFGVAPDEEDDAVVWFGVGLAVSDSVV